MTLAPGDPFCEAHGWMGHVFVHEAAHAVAALDRGIPFRFVEIASPAEWSQRLDSGGLTAGGVHMYEPTSEWVDPNPRYVAEMCVAGYLAEDAAFQHHLANSWSGDAKMLGVALRGDSEAPESRDEAMSAAVDRMGAPMAEILQSTREWIVEAFPRIRAVAQGLSGQGISTLSKTLIEYNTGPWSLTYDEVVDIAAAAG